MSIIELLAVVFAVIVLAKIITISIKPRAWMDYVAEPIYKNAKTSIVVFLILALFSGYYLLQVVSVIEIGAVMLFTVFLTGIAFLPYSKMILKMGEEMLERGVKKDWPAMIIWIILAAWILYAVFI